MLAAVHGLPCTHCMHHDQNRIHNACEGRVISVERDHGLINISLLTAHLHDEAGAHLQSKRLVIEARWVSKPLAFAGKLRPRRLNN
jgi:hypothetical protein